MNTGRHADTCMVSLQRGSHHRFYKVNIFIKKKVTWLQCEIINDQMISNMFPQTLPSWSHVWLPLFFFFFICTCSSRAVWWRWLTVGGSFCFIVKIVSHSRRERPLASLWSLLSSLICRNNWSRLCCGSTLGFHSCREGNFSSETSGASVKHERTFSDSDFVIYSSSGIQICCFSFQSFPCQSFFIFNVFFFWNDLFFFKVMKIFKVLIWDLDWLLSLLHHFDFCW